MKSPKTLLLALAPRPAVTPRCLKVNHNKKGTNSGINMRTNLYTGQEKGKLNLNSNSGFNL